MNENTITEQDIICKVECLNCHKELIGKGQLKFCSKRCSIDYRIKISIEKRRRVCVQCGIDFIMNIPSAKHNKGIVKEGQFCSRRCKGSWRRLNDRTKMSSEVFFNTCIVCGAVFTARTKRETCSRECRHQLDKSKSVEKYYLNYSQSIQASRDYYKRNWVKPDPFNCKECGKLHQPEYGDTNSKYCSIACSNRNDNRTNMPRKRARVNGVFYEYVNPIKVFERDGWRCQLCGKKLKEKNRGTIRDDAPELDHIITWAGGGSHSYKNTQCSCRKCNGLKNSRSKGQLKLFGQ